jgi:hypothetical protein
MYYIIYQCCHSDEEEFNLFRSLKKINRTGLNSFQDKAFNLVLAET